MPNVEYVTAKLEQEEFIERAEKFYLEEGGEDPYRLIKEYAERINVEVPEGLEDEEFRDRIRTREKVYLRDFRSVLDTLANQKVETRDLGELF